VNTPHLRTIFGCLILVHVIEGIAWWQISQDAVGSRVWLPLAAACAVIALIAMIVLFGWAIKVSKRQ
jgi:cytochrome bd-type quinol oxidase subunit 1